MILRLLLPLFMLIPLYAYENDNPSKVRLKMEAGIYLPKVGGSITNTKGRSEFEDDFNYKNLNASYFGITLLLDYDYTPNMEINYFNADENADATLSKNVYIADGMFNASVSTLTKYTVFNAVFYQDFKIKGRYIHVFGKSLYSGDFEFDIGLDSKIIDYYFEVQDKTDLNKPTSWIKVDKFISLPYLGFKYYLYDFTLNTSASVISYNRAESLNYKIDADYRVVGGLYLTLGYLYEQFKVLEKEDTVKFKTTGYKLSFKYQF